MFCRKKVFWMASGCCLIPFALCANPKNPTVIHGEAAVCSPSPDILEVTATDRSVIKWGAFSIDAGETTKFILPDASSTVLNRVDGGEASRLMGLLHSNGRVYLINPNGILIGKEGVIDTAGFLASTLDLADRDFLKGEELVFKGMASGSVINYGKITSTYGDVILIGYQVQNSGELSAPRGVASLAAGEEIHIFPKGDQRVAIRTASLNEEKGREGIGVYNQGKIEAIRVELKANGNPYAYAIKNEGIIEATSFAEMDGRIVLVAEKGVTTSSGTLKGDEVQVLGEVVSLTDEAVIDVSKEGGGGTILVGGDYQGKNPSILNARAALVEKGVRLLADAKEQGDGGKVVVWADEVTGCYGEISAQGGVEGGNGGCVEVSGKEALDFRGRVNTLASRGEAGTLLLDPAALTISSAVTSPAITFGGLCGSLTYCTTTAAAGNIAIADILSNLATGNVTVNAQAGTGAVTVGDITMSDPFTWTTGANTFTLLASDAINLNAGITVTSGGTFIANAALGTASTTGIVLAAGQTLSSNGDVIFNSWVNNSDVTINGAVDMDGGNLTITVGDDFTLSSTGSITMDSPGKSFTLNTIDNTTSIATFSGPVFLEKGGAIWTSQGSLALNNILTTGTANTDSCVLEGKLGVTLGVGSLINHQGTGDFTLKALTGSADITSNAAITVTSGNFSFYVGDHFTFNAASTINFSAPNKTLTIRSNEVNTTAMTFGGDIDVTAGNFTLYSGTGITWATTASVNYNVVGGQFSLEAETILDKSGQLILANGSMDIITGSHTTLLPASFSIITTPDPITLTSRSGDIIVNTDFHNDSSGNITTSSNNLYVGSLGIATSSQLGTQGGILSIQTQNDILIQGGTAVASSPLVGSAIPGTGSISASIGGNLSITSGYLGSARMSSPSTLSATVGGNLALLSGQNAGASGQARLEAAGDLSVEANNITLNSPSAQVQALMHTSSGDLLAVADQSITIGPLGAITNTGSGSITLVVDQQAPFPQQIGTGEFFLARTGSIGQLNGGNLHIFTASSSQNQILGTLNGLDYVPGLLNAYEELGVYYSTFNNNGGDPFTVYFKEGALVTATSPLGAVHPFSNRTLAFLSSEVQWMLSRSVYDWWMIPFHMCYRKVSEPPFTLSSYQINPNQTYYQGIPPISEHSLLFIYPNPAEICPFLIVQEY